MQPTPTTSATVLTGRTLLLADWKIDPHVVLAACVGQTGIHDASVALVVPAALHGIDWVGDPYGNVPCARRALDELTALLRAAGIEVASAAVGDPDPVAAATDATLSRATDQIVVCRLQRRIKLSILERRVRRATQLPVISAPVPPANRAPRGRERLQRGECGVTPRASRTSKPLAV